MPKLFNSAADASNAEQKLREQFEHLPYTSFYVSTLGGDENASVLFTMSLDAKDEWANRILENSRHAKFHLQANGKLEKISGNRVADFRSVRVNGIQNAITKLWAWLEKSRKEGAAKRFGVYKWRQDGWYNFAVKEYKSEAAAEKFASKMNAANASNNYVVRQVNPVPLAKGTKTNPAARTPRYSVTFSDGFYNVYDKKTNRTERFLVQGFIYGQGLYEERTSKYPDYVHARVWELQRRAELKLRNQNPVPLAKGTKRKRSDVRIVHNKLLGGWYIVRGAHDTPLTGRFNTKAEAQAELDWRKRHRVNPTKKATVKKTVRKANPTPRADIVKQTTRLSELLNIPIGLRNPLGQYQLHFKNRRPMSPLLSADDMKKWLHGAIQSALVCGKK